MSHVGVSFWLDGPVLKKAASKAASKAAAALMVDGHTSIGYCHYSPKPGRLPSIARFGHSLLSVGHTGGSFAQKRWFKSV